MLGTTRKGSSWNTLFQVLVYKYELWGPFDVFWPREVASWTLLHETQSGKNPSLRSKWIPARYRTLQEFVSSSSDLFHHFMFLLVFLKITIVHPDSQEIHIVDFPLEPSVSQVHLASLMGPGDLVTWKFQLLASTVRVFFSVFCYEFPAFLCGKILLGFFPGVFFNVQLIIGRY